MLTSIFLIRSEDGWPGPAIIWSIVAAISVSAAGIVASRPGHLGDLHTVREWLRYWTSTGGNPFTHYAPTLDYPPISFLVLWPLSLLPEQGLAYWFLPAAVILTTVAVWAQTWWTADCLRISLSTSERVALVAIVLAGSGTRSGLWVGQTVALSLIFGMCALQWKRSHPLLAALCLALCSFKLHVAAGFFLAVLLLAGPTVPIIASVITLLFSWLFAATVNQSLPGILIDYSRNLYTLYGGEHRVRDMLSIRFVLDDLIGWYSLSTAAYMLLGLGALTAIVVLSRRRRADATTQALVAVSSMLLSLVFLPHQAYNSLFAAPALFLLMWPESGLIPNRRVRAIWVAAYVLFGVLDPSRAIRFMVLPLTESDLVFWLSYNLNPLRPAALFTLVLWRLYQRPPREYEPAA